MTPPEPDLEGLVRHYYRCVDDGDIDGVVALFDDEAVYDRPGYAPLDGREQIDRFYRSERIIESGRHDVVQVVASGREVAVQGGFEGRLKGDRAASFRFADFFVVSATGKFLRRRTFFYLPLA